MNGKKSFLKSYFNFYAPQLLNLHDFFLETQGSSKGQLISKCPFGFIVWTKIPTKLFLDFCPEFFCSFLGASWKLFGLPGDLVCNIINKEACRKPQKAPRKPPGRYNCNNITTTLIQISRLFHFAFFSKTNHQMMI